MGGDYVITQIFLLGNNMIIKNPKDIKRNKLKTKKDLIEYLLFKMNVEKSPIRGAFFMDSNKIENYFIDHGYNIESFILPNVKQHSDRNIDIVNPIVITNLNSNYDSMCSVRIESTSAWINLNNNRVGALLTNATIYLDKTFLELLRVLEFEKKKEILDSILYSCSQYYYTFSTEKSNTTNRLKYHLFKSITGVITNSGNPVKEGRIEHIINKSIGRVLKNDENLTSQVLESNSEIYRYLLVRLKTKYEEEYKDKLNKFKETSGNILLSFLRAGYSLTNNQLYKEVNIVPEHFYKGNQLYKYIKLPREYIIKKLFLDLSCLFTQINISAVGLHPNVNTGERNNNETQGRVCLGDTVSRRVRDLTTKGETEIVDTLFEIEELLKCVNYDSSYYQDKKLDSELIGSTTEISKNFKSNMATNIKNLSIRRI